MASKIEISDEQSVADNGRVVFEGDMDIEDIGDVADIIDDQLIMLTFEKYDQFDNVPTITKWRLPTLTKVDKHDKLRSWTIGFDGKKGTIIHGTNDGKKQVDKFKVKLNSKSENIQSQAWLEITQRVRLKIRSGYVPIDSNIPAAMQLMRAKAYKPGQYLNLPIMAERKYDGFRCAIYRGGDKIIYKSRQGCANSNLSHADEMFLQLLSYLPTNCVLDCEIYRHGMAFEDTQSILSTKTHIPQEIFNMQFYIFDFCCQENIQMEARRRILERAFRRYYRKNNIAYYSEEPKKIISRDRVSDLKISFKIGHNPIPFDFHYLLLSPAYVIEDTEELDKLFYESISDGYEGLMIKKISNGAKIDTAMFKETLYHRQKCSNILKYKTEETSEGICTDVFNDSKGREAGCGILEILVDDDEFGPRKFRLKMMGTHESRRKFVADPDSVIGKVIEFKFQNWSSTGVPRFGVGVRVRDLDVS